MSIFQIPVSEFGSAVRVYVIIKQLCQVLVWVFNICVIVQSLGEFLVFV